MKLITVKRIMLIYLVSSLQVLFATEYKVIKDLPPVEYLCKEGTDLQIEAKRTILSIEKSSDEKVRIQRKILLFSEHKITDELKDKYLKSEKIRYEFNCKDNNVHIVSQGFVDRMNNFLGLAYKEYKVTIFLSLFLPKTITKMAIDTDSPLGT